MTDETKEKKVEENFKELLKEVSKIGDLIEEVDNADKTNSDAQKEEKSVITDDNLQEYVYKSATDLIDSSLYTLEKIKQCVSGVMDHKELTALANLINATTSSIDVLNKVAMSNKKLENAKKMKDWKHPR